ncbi:MAG: 50S ribosomal protein L29 [Candidatus Thorarchaeota archaeon]|nr:MAG: 50S ribosomal protein L29 [Candidatus Thorarchaeota archaeon]RLI61464.1 MAG: 50S ribosomal protein L29 [Candidatus Thorarchaeota archaeon]
MARLTAKDIRKLTPAERKKKLEELYDELSSVRIQMATGGGTENPYRIRAVKRAIARILTIEREEELEAVR